MLLAMTKGGKKLALLAMTGGGGEKVDDPLQMYLSDVCTLPINIAGLPAISIPAGFANGLPIGMQIIAKPFAEETILKIAYAYQQATEWHKKKPLMYNK